MYLLILPRRAIVSLLRKKMGYIMIEMYKVAIVCVIPRWILVDTRLGMESLGFVWDGERFMV